MFNVVVSELCFFGRLLEEGGVMPYMCALQQIFNKELFWIKEGKVASILR